MSAPETDAFLPEPLERLAPYWGLLMAVLIAYANIFDNAFLFDDDLLIKMNVFLRDWDHIGDILTGSTTSGVRIAGGFFRPLQILLYLFAYQAGDGGTFWFHALNLGLHGANACLMYRLGTRMGFKPVGVFLASLLWAVHPLHTEAITYMSATADPLFAFFCLLGLLVMMPDFSARRIWMAMPLFLLGLVSKETTVVLPLLACVGIFFTSPRRTDFRTYAPTWPLWAVMIAFVLWRANTAGFDGPQTYARYYEQPQFAELKRYAGDPVLRFYTFLATLPAYLKLFVWPTGLHMERFFSIPKTFWSLPVLTGALLSAAGALPVVAALRKPSPVVLSLAWGALWFGAAHAPDTGILIPMNALFLEHWMYLPSVGLFLGLAEGLSLTLQGRKPPAPAWGIGAIAAVAVAALALTARTIDQNGLWRDPVVFYTNIFNNGENSARAHNNLALYHSDRGDYARAIEHFEKAIQAADSYAETRYNLALTYLRMDSDAAKAVEHLERALELEPRFFRASRTLQQVYTYFLHDPQKAAFYQAQADANEPK